MTHRVAVTGVGAICPVGTTAEASFDGLVNGTSGIVPVPFEVPGSQVSVCALVRDFDPEAHLGKKSSRRTSRFTQLALVAAREAAKDSRISERREESTRIGVVLGVGFGGIETVEENMERLGTRGARGLSAYGLPAMMGNAAAASIGIEFGAKGPCYSIAASCASGGIAIANAYELIRNGVVDIAVAGGAEAAVTPLSIAGFDRIGALSRASDPRAACLPFDLRREGFVLGEGAGVLVLERLRDAYEARVRIYGEVAGCAITSDAHHLTAPDPDANGAASAMTQSMRAARMQPDAIQYVNAHGTGTRQNDSTETLAIKKAFGPRAPELWVSSTKSMTGHLLGAAGAAECVFSALSLRSGTVPPTLTLEVPDPSCDLDYVPKTARKGALTGVMSNSFGFGGHNVSIVLRRV